MNKAWLTDAGEVFWRDGRMRLLCVVGRCGFLVFVRRLVGMRLRARCRALQKSPRPCGLFQRGYMGATLRP